jgi:protein tyrosine phosphatase (PTP) superfamily phosphohydrolase (DUF442 family)
MSAPLEQIYNFVSVSERLATAGQPTESQFADIKASGFAVVINLRTLDTPGAIGHEAELVKAQGMDYIHIPVVWQSPTSRNLDDFLDALRANRGRKAFVHCAANMRVSAFMFLYHVTQEGMPREDAEALMHRIWEPNPTWQAFIGEQLTRLSGPADAS